MSHSMLTIFNAALTSQGMDEVSENDGSNEYRVLARKWPTIIGAELEDGGYFFTRQQYDLTNRVDGKFGFTDSYLVPSTALFVKSLWVEDDSGERDLSFDWLQDGSYVHVNYDSGVTIEVMETPEVDIWGENFVAGITAKMEAVVLRSLREEPAAAERMEAVAESYLQRARTISSKARSTTDAFQRSRLAAARFRRG